MMQNPTAVELADAYNKAVDHAAALLDEVFKLTEAQHRRLTRIRLIIEAVDNRAMHADGPVTPTLQEMSQKEMSAIYALACGEEVDA